MRPFFLGVVLAILLSGCSSIESTLISESADGTVQSKTFNGVPILITVPQKIAYVATESIYKVVVPDSNGDTVSAVKTATLSETTVDKTPILLGDTKLFTVDAKRPIFGTSKSKITLDAERKYPEEITNDVDDKTLSEAFKGVQTFADKLFEKQGTDDAAPIQKTLVRQRQFLLIYDPSTLTITKQEI